MISKPNKVQTKKYSSLVSNIKDKQPQQEEPKITEEQVRKAFEAFNLPINERGHNDILYWTQKPQSDGQKLIEELHKKRMDINNKEDEDNKTKSDREKAIQKSEDDKKTANETILNRQHVDKATMPRLSDEDLSSLFDEYGLPAPDPEWARSHLPNDPKKIRSILEMQRKTADDMLKKHSKNTVNAIPEVPKNVPQQSMPMQQGAPMMGMGGPSSPMGMQGDMSGGDQPVTPFFIGDSAVCRIVNPTNPNVSTLWLIDPQKKVLQPFMSEQAFENAFDDPEEARKSVITLSSKDLGPGGVLSGFELLKGTQGVSPDGVKNNIEFSKSQLQNRYGKQEDPAAENKALSMLDGIMGNLGNPKSPQQPPEQPTQLTPQQPQL